ncbi:MAG: HigA family addiction module antitoxin [Acidobacteriaceae bacterium]
MMAIPRDPKRKPPPMHPGEILREEFMVPKGISAHALAMALRVPSTRISQIVNERRGITADTAYRLAIHFGTSADLWMNLQSSYELSKVQHSTLPAIQREVPRRVA